MLDMWGVSDVGLQLDGSIRVLHRTAGGRGAVGSLLFAGRKKGGGKGGNGKKGGCKK